MKSRNKDFFYIGSTYDIEKRLQDHALGKSPTTRRFLPVDLVYYEAYLSDFDANNREEKLKQYGSTYQNLKKRIKRSICGGAG